ncbi:MAG: adenylosuccinate synthetase, partial [Clostridiales bacterium]|nr:adenylosuccinate synthetase [Clostridiales bacterium]
NGRRIERFPYTPDLYGCRPIYDVLPGWERDIGRCRAFGDLPAAARDYVNYVEQALGAPIRFISVGPERDALIAR